MLPKENKVTRKLFRLNKFLVCIRVYTTLNQEENHSFKLPFSNKQFPCAALFTIVIDFPFGIYMSPNC